MPICKLEELPSSVCGLCEEPFCLTHNMHFHDCSCVTLSWAEQEGYPITEKGGNLYADVPDEEIAWPWEPNEIHSLSGGTCSLVANQD